MRHYRTAAIAIAALAPLFTSCSKPKPVANTEKVCREKFEKASKLYNKGKDGEAQEKLRDLTVGCSGYDFVEEAQYMLAQSHYRTEQWIEAETEFGILVENYERTSHLEEARWKIARSAYEQSPTWDRDPGLTTSAIKRYRAYLADFPAAPHTDSARADLAKLQDKMAMRRYRTGKLYMRMDEPLAATMYYNLLLREYPDFKFAQLARLDVARAYARLDQFDRARETLDTLRQDSVQAAAIAEDIADVAKYVDKVQAKFDKRKAKEAAKAKRGDL